ncbi:uncharacterized protein F5891DRAFT_1193708 [Suillus fuscotomentosus]|uniref:Uncharacterized protein n=1 Tax=Suillus fuscotomentosus TaxID=1912939 RepID=A0AAD4HGN5_9AGAM|nr:uncharacterized protein F5891DRAFT_1193708 [Suillus fuscotomentosus]KAG1895888.1 hypothetical protein F5891DRAFT_1193708 [Suillus fuscotomentosus]
MNCSNIGDYLDVASAYDRWKDGKTLTMPECRIKNSRSLDMGFDRFPSQPVSDTLDMGFPLSNTNRSSIATPISELDMGFPPGHSFNTNDFAEPATGSLNFLAHNQLAGGSVNVLVKDSPLDMGFNSPPVQHGHPDIDMGFRSPVQHHDPDQRSLDMGFHSPQAQHHDPDQMSLDMGFYSPPVQHRDPEQMSFDMGFNSPVVQHDHPNQRPSGVDPVDIPDQSMGLRSEETPLDMGFGTDPAHDLAHQLNIQPEETPLEMASELEPIGFVIQRAVGDLRLAMHWLEIERAHGTMSPEEALVSEEVLQSTSELLLAFQLISIYRLST